MRRIDQALQDNELKCYRRHTRSPSERNVKARTNAAIRIVHDGLIQPQQFDFFLLLDQRESYRRALQARGPTSAFCSAVSNW